VLSASTRDYDRGQKFDLYRSIPTLRDCLFIDQYAVEVEHRWLDGSTWRSDRYVRPEDIVKLTGVPVTLMVDAMYELVER
jgi:Uma2 family endonuclease